MVQGSFRNVGLKLPVDSPQDLQLKLKGFYSGRNENLELETGREC